MGSIPSREILYKPPEFRKSEIHPRRYVYSFPTFNRLVRDELCKEIQRSLHQQKGKTCDRLPVLQVTPKSLQ